jgi:hypothetical protein
LIFAIATIAHAAPVSNPQTIQWKLDALPRGNGIVRGDAPVGGVVDLDAKVIRLAQPLLLGSGQELVGRGASTVIEWNGPAGTAAILLRSYADHGYVHLPAIRNLTIYCPNGADAVALHPSARHVERLEMNRVTIRGGRINLPGENYFCRFDDVRFVDTKLQALRLDGQGHTLRSVCLEANGRLPNDAPRPPGIIEIRGSATFADYCRLEGDYDCPLLYAADWNRWPGRITVPGGWWFEPHRNGTSAVFVNTRYHGIDMNALSHFPWKLVNSTAYTDSPCDPNGVIADENSAVYVGTVRVPTTPEQRTNP